MQEEKKWWESRTVWGGLVAIGAAAAGAAGYQVDADTQGQAVELILAGITAVGGLLAIVGRVKATKAIKK
jgi:hypothetical protein